MGAEGKCIPVIKGQRLLDSEGSEGKMDGFGCQAITHHRPRVLS